MNTYKTAEIAKFIGIHPNTVRLYEELGLIPKPERKPNGYRIFTDFHIEQFRFARTALKVEVLQNGLRKQAINIIKTSAAKDFDRAIYLTNCYLKQIKSELQKAEETIATTEMLLSGEDKASEDMLFTRKEVLNHLLITMDTLRNWEMNGLLTARRKQNGYRVYTSEDIKRLQIIRTLRCANYSLAAILRMMNALSNNPETDIREIIDVPPKDDDIISVCDKLLTSLRYAEKNAFVMLTHLDKMKKLFISNPTL